MPELRKRQDLTIVPEEAIMKKTGAPNMRLDTIVGNLGKELAGTTDEDKMYELLQKLGLSKPDEDGSSYFKKQNLVPEKTLRHYI